jgi:hypothetical protein
LNCIIQSPYHMNSRIPIHERKKMKDFSYYISESHP